MAETAVQAPAVARPPGTQPAANMDDMHHDIARDIGQQVEMMILDAKHQSEVKVGKEIHKVKLKMEQMGEKIKTITERVARLEPAGAGLLKADLQKSITKLEEVWEGEVGTLKHELWQTIQAHNHNADLLKHHKDAIDQVQGRMTEAAPNPEIEQVHAQLMMVDKVIQREQAKDQQMDQLMNRLGAVQQQLVGGVMGTGSWPTAGAVPGFPGVPQASATGPGQAQAATVAAASAKKPARKDDTTAKAGKAKAKAKQAAKAASAASLQAAAASLRAEAPEFVPTAAFGAD